MSEVLVTGGAGFIGSHLADALVAEGNSVTVVDDLSRGRRSNIKSEVDFREQSITEPLEDLVERSDYVYHLAALARVRPSIEDPVGYNKVNLDGTLNVLDACRKFGKKIIFASSSSVFGESEPPFSEEAKFDPKNPYAMQKLMGEMYIRLYNQLYGLDYTILRYFNVYGSRQIIGGAYSTVIGIFLDQNKKGEPMTIFGDGEQRRDFTHIDDVTKANLLARNFSGEFNIGRGNNRSVNEIADLIGGDRVNLPAVVGESRFTLCDNSKAEEVMGWIPEIDVTKEVIERLYEEAA
ncbi:MAG: NAD-dependent epimerase/dehydratase family protein [Nitrospirae bacterium]|nr:MAG: NAD-dependent epimerase/dehydratase family protein [Nitrospirota bacterium]